jgi:hypothetical protein
MSFNIYFLSHSYRTEAVATQSYDEDSIFNVALNYSNLYNSMLYPFTRTVIYGVIWYQGKQLNSDISYKQY